MDEAEKITVAPTKRSPSDFLKQVLGRPVVVKLNTGEDYRGVLACLDGYMNIAMEQTEEYSDGQLKARYGDCFIRGNNADGEETTTGDFSWLQMRDRQVKSEVRSSNRFKEES